MTHWPQALPPARPRSGWWWVIGGLVAVLVVTGAPFVVVLIRTGDGTVSAVGPPSPTPQATSAASAEASLGGLRTTLTPTAARSLLAALPASADLPTGYDRDAFGPAWADIDGNGCNQRDDVLLRDVIPGTVRTAPQGSCDHDVLAGQWYDPYTGTVLTFDDMKQPQQAEALQIDHVVPLAETYRSGAYAWTAKQKEHFANDLDNLVAVGGAANSAKGDSDPAGWLPPVAVRCAYAETWVAVKSRWALSVDATERAAIARVLDGC